MNPRAPGRLRRGGSSLDSAILSAGTTPLSTLEARWILPGLRPVGMTRWLSRFPTATEVREDLYLIADDLPRLSVKIRGSSLLEIKLEEDDSRMLDIPGLATAGVRACKKWSFQLPADSTGMAERGGWRRVRKARRISRFSPVIGTVPGAGPAGKDGAACAVELTDIEVDSEVWWTLGLEVAGPRAEAWEAMKTTAAALFADPLPASVGGCDSTSSSYSDWLRFLCLRSARSLSPEASGGASSGAASSGAASSRRPERKPPSASPDMATSGPMDRATPVSAG